AQAEVAGILLDRHQLDSVHTETAQVRDTFQEIEEFAVQMIRPLGECSDVQFIYDEVVEGRRAEAGVVPGKTGRIAHQAVAVRESRLKSQLAGTRVALVANAARSVDVEEILLTLLQPGEEPAPVAAADPVQRAVIVLFPAVEIARQPDLFRIRR